LRGIKLGGSDNLKVLLLGLGNVGKELLRLFQDRKDQVGDFQVVGAMRRNGLSSPIESPPKPRDLKEVLDSLLPDVLIDVSSPNYESGEPSTSAYLEAFKRGIHVITANKAPLALHFVDLMGESLKRNVKLMFQATVMSGVPSINLKRVLPASHFISVEGILNGTSNYILTKMYQGISLRDALRDAQELGYAEPDPKLDLNGFDAAAKITILSNVYLNSGATIKDVTFDGIQDLSLDYLLKCREKGLKPKLVATASRSELKVSVVPLDSSHPLYGIDGVNNGLLLRTDLEDILISGPGAGPRRAAYGVLSDLVLLKDSLPKFS